MAVSLALKSDAEREDQREGCEGKTRDEQGERMRGMADRNEGKEQE